MESSVAYWYSDISHQHTLSNYHLQKQAGAMLQQQHINSMLQQQQLSQQMNHHLVTMQGNNINNNNTSMSSLNVMHRPASSKLSPIPNGSISPSTEPDEENKTNLIINYLPQNMTQEEIRTLFGSIGEVESCKLIRDKQTGQSLGYGFVNFKKAEDADKAIRTLNQLKIQNKTIKVSLARPSSETIKGANVYVCGLPKSMTQLDLETLFREHGEIISSRILTDPATGISKGVGFIRFDKRHEAERAIEKLNGVTPIGSTEKITVKFANTPNSKVAATGIPMALAASYLSPVRQVLGPIHHAAGRFSSLYRFSPFDTTAALIPTASAAAQTVAANPFYSHLAAATPINPAALTQLHVPASLTSAGLAASSLSQTHPSVQQQMAQLAQMAPASSQSAASTTPAAGNQSWTLLVYNLPPEADEKLIWQLFGPFGAVLSVKTIMDSSSSTFKGIALVTMADYNQALLAITSLHGLEVGDKALYVNFKPSNPLFVMNN